MKTKIPIGSLCSQDFDCFVWPRANDDPETVFIAKKGKRYFTLVAPGYGERGDYGNGAIHIFREHLGTQWTKEKALIPKALT